MLLTKSEAARRQIDSAIAMYFDEGDPVSIHTLVGAAHILIIDLSKAAGLQSVIDRHIKPEMRWKFEGAIRRPQNFLKHADDDPDETFDFNPHNTELMLFIDIEMFKELVGSATDPMRAFHTYAAATFGRESFERFPQDALDDLAVRAAEMSKREFFTFVMEFLAHGRAGGTIE